MFRVYIYIYTYVYVYDRCGAREFVVPAKGPRRGEWLPTTSNERPNILGVQPRMTLSSASRGLKGNNDTSSKTASKALPEEKASGMGLAGGCGVGIVQGKNVTSALNAPTNVLVTLMGKDP